MKLKVLIRVLGMFLAASPEYRSRHDLFVESINELERYVILNCEYDCVCERKFRGLLGQVFEIDSIFNGEC